MEQLATQMDSTVAWFAPAGRRYSFVKHSMVPFAFAPRRQRELLDQAETGELQEAMRGWRCRQAGR
jgi:hypothetical protein